MTTTKNVLVDALEAPVGAGIWTVQPPGVVTLPPAVSELCDRLQADILPGALDALNAGLACCLTHAVDASIASALNAAFFMGVYAERNRV